MKHIFGWGLLVVFLASLCVGAAACSHSNKDSGSPGTQDSSTEKKREKPDSGDGY
jgi:hypothetical protein